MSLNQSFISDFSEYSRCSQKTKIKYKLHYGSFNVTLSPIMENTTTWLVKYILMKVETVSDFPVQ